MDERDVQRQEARALMRRDNERPVHRSEQRRNQHDPRAERLAEPSDYRVPSSRAPARTPQITHRRSRLGESRPVAVLLGGKHEEETSKE